MKKETTNGELKYYQNQMDKIGGELIRADSKVTLLNRGLKQKNLGFELLSELQQTIGTDTNIDIIFKTTLNHVNEHLKMDSSIILSNINNSEFELKHYLGKSKNEDFNRKIQFKPSTDELKNYFLVNRSIKPTDIELALQNQLGIKFFIAVPIYVHGKLTNYLIATRNKEAQPFYPPFNIGDIKTFTSIAGFLSSALTNNSLYNSLNEAKKTVEDYSHTLEDKVIERTQTINLKNKELEQINIEVMHSITYAKRIQTAILPDDNFIKKILPSSYVFYLPKDIVAGDFYWLEKKDDLILFAAADCTGHGVPGAMVSVVCHNALNRAVREFKISSPGKILDIVSHMVVEAFSNGDEEVKDGMDIALCAYQTSTKKLLFSGALNGLYIIKKIKDLNRLEENTIHTDKHYLKEIKGNRQPVGKFDYTTPFTTHEIHIEEGDQIVIFSDGFADQFGGEKGKKYKSKAFKKLLLSIQEQTLEDQKNILNKEFIDWKGDLEQTDDIIVMAVQF